MRAIDEHLQKRSLLAWQRPLHIGLLLHEAIGWEGPVYPPKDLADQPGFAGPVLMAKAHRWYEEVYGDKLNIDLGPGHVPFQMANTIWRVRMPYTVGRCLFFADRDLGKRGRNAVHDGDPATLNVLCMIDELPTGLAGRLTDQELRAFTQFYGSAFNTLFWASRLEGDPLFDQARHDYAASVDDLLNARYAQSRWASSQTVEKTLKGLLNLAGLPYSRKGSDGHDLTALASQLSTVGVSLDVRIVSKAKCSAGVRYGEVPSAESETLNANHAALGVWEMLSQCRKTAELLGKVKRSGPPKK